MTISSSLPDPPDFQVIGAWVGGILFVGTAAVFAVVRAIGKIKLLADSMPEERPTRIITADTVAMRQLAGALDDTRATAIETNALLKQLLDLARDLVRRADDDRRKGDISDEIQQQLAEHISLFEKALKKRPPARSRRRPATPPQT